jgi:hypothetical protein
MNIWKKTLIAAGAALVLAVSVAVPANATDTGGNGSPSGCAGAYTVKSATIYGSRGTTAGKPIGQVQMRWSQSCYGNWTRVVLYGGLYKSPVNIVEEIDSEGRSAMADDTVKMTASGVTAWTPLLKLAHSQSAACSYATVSSDFGTLNYHTNGASVCA